MKDLLCSQENLRDGEILKTLLTQADDILHRAGEVVVPEQPGNPVRKILSKLTGRLLNPYVRFDSLELDDPVLNLITRAATNEAPAHIFIEKSMTKAEKPWCNVVLLWRIPDTNFYQETVEISADNSFDTRKATVILYHPENLRQTKIPYLEFMKSKNRELVEQYLLPVVSAVNSYLSEKQNR